MESLLAIDLAPSIAKRKLCFSLHFNKKFQRENSNNFKKEEE